MAASDDPPPSGAAAAGGGTATERRVARVSFRAWGATRASGAAHYHLNPRGADGGPLTPRSERRALDSFRAAMESDPTDIVMDVTAHGGQRDGATSWIQKNKERRADAQVEGDGNTLVSRPAAEVSGHLRALVETAAEEVGRPPPAVHLLDGSCFAAREWGAAGRGGATNRAQTHEGFASVVGRTTKTDAEDNRIMADAMASELVGKRVSRYAVPKNFTPVSRPSPRDTRTAGPTRGGASGGGSPTGSSDGGGSSA